MTPLSTLGLMVNFTRPHANEGLLRLLSAARETGIQLLAPRDVAAFADDVHPCAPEVFLKNGAQGVISLGGDGTFLATSHTLTGLHLPIIGLNIGHLGYLTAVNEEGFSQLLFDLKSGNYTVESRTTIASVIHHEDGKIESCSNALNDVVMSRAKGGRTIAVCLELDASPVARWICDGVILSTPTGSTAYSLSVGGPVVVPSAKVLIINVIAPHTLSARPLIVPENTHVTLRLDCDNTEASVDVDGVQQAHITRGDILELQRSSDTVQIILPKRNNPYQSLSRKLHWGEAFIR